MSQPHLPSIQQVIDRLEVKLTDLSSQADLYKSGQLDQFYNLLIDSTVSEILDVPIDRILAGYPPFTDEWSMEEHVEQIAEMVGAFFNKTPKIVTADLCSSISVDADYDIRMARIARGAGKLH